jgi:NAD(P)-dependent dehydrogenase (short-subunit alcohol dehydrogenase family)
MFDFTGRAALICGASGALGSVLVRRFLAAGARVDTIDRDAARTSERLADLAVGEALRCHGADLADAEAVERTVGAILADRGGRVDHVVNAAGAFAADGAVEAGSLETWRRLIDANLHATLFVCRAVVGPMKLAGGGTIVNVGSRASLHGDAGVAAYAVAKTAVLRLTESLAAEGRAAGVRVNCVLPGTMDTPANRHAMPDADPSRWVELDAVADAILFLSSPAARGIHGAAVPVFGLE